MPLIVFVSTFLLSLFSIAQPADYTPDEGEVIIKEESNLFVHNNLLFEQKWDDLNETKFWKKIMLLSNDSLVLNIARTREVLMIVDSKTWRAQTNSEKEAFRDALRSKHGLDANERIYATTGKNDFYHFDLAIPSISAGIKAFEENQVDPWYAQAILLIESPGQLKKSTTGAYGPFQLMPGVARANGLMVNRSLDERKDFNRSAQAASNLIKTVCVPKAKEILDKHGMSYAENELWFRLFVLHVYHAGSGNVNAVVNAISPESTNMTGMDLIRTMWHTKAAAFGNNSQNYSQLAIASQMILQDHISALGQEVNYCQFP